MKALFQPRGKSFGPLVDLIFPETKCYTVPIGNLDSFVAFSYALFLLLDGDTRLGIFGIVVIFVIILLHSWAKKMILVGDLFQLVKPAMQLLVGLRHVAGRR